MTRFVVALVIGALAIGGVEVRRERAEAAKPSCHVEYVRPEGALLKCADGSYQWHGSK